METLMCNHYDFFVKGPDPIAMWLPVNNVDLRRRQDGTIRAFY